MTYSEPTAAVPFRLTDNVSRHVLGNGLTVLIKQNHTAPVVALLASVQIGYFNEPDRWNGLAHVVEHMLFKGTPRRPDSEQVAREIRQLGGIVNAATYYEETYYYVIVPSAHIEAAMEIQADAFQNSLLDAGELAKEIEVIVQESMQKRDNPNAMLVESLYAFAYDSHRIRRWRMGMPETLRAFRHEDLVAFVEQTYRPENITFTVVGDVTIEMALALVEKYWAGMPRGTLQKEDSPLDPPHTGFRYRRMTGNTHQRLLIFGLPCPPILHDDAPGLMVLGALLSDGRSSRLYQRLKEELRLVNSVWASYEGFKDIGIFTLGAESIDDDPLPVERALWAEVTRIQTEPITPEELQRIKTRVETRRLFSQEEVMGMARTLANYESLGDYRLSDTLIERLRAVTPEEVRRIANAYLSLPQAALVEYLPASIVLPPEQSPEQRFAELDTETDALVSQTEVTSTPAMPVAISAVHTEATTPSGADTEAAVAIDLPQGGTLYFRARHDLPIVSIQIYFRGGRRNENRRNCGLTNLMLKSAMKGTASYSADQIASRVESLGSGIGQALGMDNFGFGIKLRRDVLHEGFQILSEVIAQPNFPAEEVEREKQAIYAEIRRQQDNNFSLAYDLFAAACYGDLPYGLPSNGITEVIEQTTVADLKDWHSQLLIANNLAIGIVGDLTQEEAIALCAQLPLPTSVSDTVFRNGNLHFAPYAEQVTRRPKHQTAAVLGFPGAELSNPDRYALDLLSEITSGMGGRFFRSVRGENALAYQVTSFHRSRKDAGNFVAYTSTAPENEQKARELLLAECARLAREPVPAEELAAAKAAIVGEHTIGTQTFGAQASELAAAAVYQFAPDEPQRYLERIQKLTAEEIRTVAERYLRPDQYWLGIVRGPQSEESSE